MFIAFAFAFVTSMYDASVYDVSNDRGVTGYLSGPRSLAPEGLEGQSQEAHKALNRLLVLIYLQTTQANSSARKAENLSFDISPYSKIYSFQEYH